MHREVTVLPSKETFFKLSILADVARAKEEENIIAAKKSSQFFNALEYEDKVLENVHIEVTKKQAAFISTDGTSLVIMRFDIEPEDEDVIAKRTGEVRDEIYFCLNVNGSSLYHAIKNVKTGKPKILITEKYVSVMDRDKPKTNLVLAEENSIHRDYGRVISFTQMEPRYHNGIFSLDSQQLFTNLRFGKRGRRSCVRNGNRCDNRYDEDRALVSVQGMDYAIYDGDEEGWGPYAWIWTETSGELNGDIVTVLLVIMPLVPDVRVALEKVTGSFDLWKLMEKS